MKKNYTLLCLLMTFTFSINAANVFWNTNVTSGNFNDAANWFGGVVPGSSDYAIINANGIVGGITVNINTATSISNIRIISATLNVNSTLTCDGSAPGASGMWVQGVVNNNGTITISNTTAHGIHLNGAAGTFTNGAGATINIDGGITGRGIIAQAGSFVNNGIINIDGCSFAGIETSVSFGNSGTINIGVTTACGNRGINNSSTFTNSGNINIGTVAFEGLVCNNGATFNNSGTFFLAHGGSSNSYAAPGTGVFNNTGTLKGSGNVEGKTVNFTNSGIISPGSSPGSMSFFHGYTNSTFIAELASLGSFDQLTFTNGTASLFNLAGTLDVQFLGAYVPDINDQFMIINAINGFTGTFATINWPTPASEWEIAYNANDVTIKYIGTVAPVELTKFTVEAMEDAIELKWETASEISNKGFEIEKLTLNKKWIPFAWVDGNHSTAQTSNYSYIDENPLDGLNYYRLKQVDEDNSFEYSNIVEINWTKIDNHFILYPNPAKDIINIGLSSPNEIGHLRVFDTLGHLIIDSNSPEKQLDIFALQPGIYILQVQTQKAIHTSTFVKK